MGLIFLNSPVFLSEVVGILSLASKLGLGAGTCISNILDTEWGQNLLPNAFTRWGQNLFSNGDKTFYVFHIYSTKSVFRKNYRNIKNKSAHSIHNLTEVSSWALLTRRNYLPDP
jgi:hypothetical protein